MKFFILLTFPLFLLATSFNAEIRFSGEPIIALKTIENAFSTLGYRFEINNLTAENSSGELHGTATGNRAISAEAVKESFKEQGITIENMSTEQQTLSMSVDAQKALMGFPLLGSDDGFELKKVHSAQWYRVEEAQSIRIDSPYGSDWYPDVSVFDESMNLLYTVRSHEVRDGVEFELPSGARYLKVSNLQGMKVLREGMWIESKSLGR